MEISKENIANIFIHLVDNFQAYDMCHEKLDQMEFSQRQIEEIIAKTTLEFVRSSEDRVKLFESFGPYKRRVKYKGGSKKNDTSALKDLKSDDILSGKKKHPKAQDSCVFICLLFWDEFIRILPEPEPESVIVEGDSELEESDDEEYWRWKM